MTDETIHTGPHRRFVFTNGGMRIEEEQRDDVGTVWRTVGSLSMDELRQLSSELESRDITP